MTESSERVIVTKVSHITVVELTDRKILDEVSIAQIAEVLYSLVGASPLPKIVVDFVNVAHMSSSALGILINLNKRIRERHGELRLCNIQPSIYEVFAITRLNTIFQIATTRDEALASVQ